MSKKTLRLYLNCLFSFCFIISVLGNGLLLANEVDVNEEKRIALVIGNSDYEFGSLANPKNDAEDIAKALEGLNFQVIKGTNLYHSEIRELISEFGDLLKTADVAVFYFAGHGFQFNGENYLIPLVSIDEADSSGEKAVANDSISTDKILQDMDEAGNAVNIVILDACRNTPFSDDFKLKGTGLAELKGPTGSLIAYATGPGKTALDGSKRNGLYTHYLLQNMKKTGLSVEQVFKKVRIGVINDSGGGQVPWENSSLLREFYFSEEKENSDANDQINYELRFWKSADKSESRSFYQAYLEKYPNGHFSDLAQSKIKQFDFGRLTIRSNVFGDSIKINGEYRGSSQLDVELKQGSYSVEVTKEGYEPFTMTVPIKNNEQQQLNVQLRAIKINLKQEPVEKTIKTVARTQNSISTAILKNVRLQSESVAKLDEAATSNNLSAIEFIKVAAGCFSMGSPFSEEGRLNDELQHEVCLSKDYWLGKYEVTQGQWLDIMGKNPAYFKACGSDCPVERVSWNDVQAYIFRLNQKTGKNYRLPTEAEWEYAARAGHTSATYAGEPEWNGGNNVPELDAIAWYSGNSGVKYKGGKYCEDWEEKQFDAFRCGTKQVGLKKANPWGFFDMLGNVWEWTNDRYGSYSSNQNQDPKGAKKGPMRVTRGGNWADSLQQNRAAARYGFGVRAKQNNVGFRLAR